MLASNGRVVVNDDGSPPSIGPVGALNNGDLEGFARWLKAGCELDDELRSLLVQMIRRDPEARYHLFSKGRRPGEKGSLQDARLDHRTIEIGIYVERTARDRPDTPIGDIIDAAETRFGVGTTVVTDARTTVRKLLAGDIEDCGLRLDPAPHWMELALAFPELEIRSLSHRRRTAE
ncbi:hypothetical protein [Novosphingobium sp. Gsoil 351]|uniref:hypothetical protein n=1 Tax=Novosphingobium sp. Gsoil 351 TaxID=2675225 RepID=UPI0012B49497|nr:hypothetical protein [Novosphingobium sp. Gsoil 351]QGN53472.1 hypothetical protein GKE62_01835 [Novosphingobium sp. Gsoil 351]